MATEYTHALAGLALARLCATKPMPWAYWAMAAVLPVLLFIYAGIWMASLTVRDPDAAPHHGAQASIWSTVRQPAILAFFAASFSPTSPPCA